MEDVWNCEDPPDSEWISYEDPDQGYVGMEFAAPIPPNNPKVVAPISNESSMSDYCRLHKLLSLCPLWKVLM